MTLKQTMLRKLGHQPWLRGRDRVLRALSHPDRQPSTPFECNFHGLSYSGNLQNFIDWTVFYYGSFQEHELLLLAALAHSIRARGNPVNFFDVGANIGHHSLFMSKQADQVFSFEPYSVVREELGRKMKHAGVRNVTAFPVALGDKNQRLAFHPPTGANQGTGTLSSDLPSNAAAESIEVEVVRGDDYFASSGLPPVSILKLDVEGFEMESVQGMRETRHRDRPPILMEVHIEGPERNAAKQARLQDLLYPNHKLFEVDAPRAGSNGHNGYKLAPHTMNRIEEVLVLPIELVGKVPGT